MSLFRSRTLGVLLACLVLPFTTDAVTVVPVPPPSSASCCNLASSFATGLFPGGNGDEGFFGVPIGAPANAMILLDDSGSMMDFPQAVQYPSLSNGAGTCSGTYLDAYTSLMTDTPYDNGNVGQNSFTVDDPPWGLNRCQTGGANKCLFKGSSYYKHRDWAVDSATEYASGSSTSSKICYGTGTQATACQTCLDTAGYYFFRNSSGNRSLLFKGSFLNGYPPKFVIARRVVKKLAYVDLNVPTATDSMRFGLTVFQPNSENAGGQSSSLRADDGGVLLVPLGPDCDSALVGFQRTSDAAATAARLVYQQARQAIIDAVNNTALVPFSTYTPLAETLYNIGQYFSDRSTSTGAGLYDDIFGSGWVRAGTGGNNFRQTSSGSIGAAWTGGAARQASICWKCQQNSIIIVTDGEPTQDNNLPSSSTSGNHTTGPTPGTSPSPANPNNDFRRWNYSGFACPSPGCGSGNLLHKVAYFLYHTDLRSDLPNDAQTQSVTTYAISFGISAGTVAATLLQQTASLGGGKFYNTSSGDELETALINVVTETVARSTSFSVSNTNTLQTSASNNLFLARFKKLLSAAWEGHLFRFKIFNEFVQGCDKTKNTASQTLAQCKKKDGGTKNVNPNLDGKEDCNAKATCDGIYILDGNCDPVTEDGSGNFVKGTFDATHKLVAAGVCTAADPSGCATAYWDAGRALSHPDDTGYRSADENDANRGRKILTVIDRNGDGLFTAADGTVEFAGANAAAIAPFLAIDKPWCAALLERTGFCTSDPAAVTASVPLCPDPAAAIWDGANTIQCARQIIYYVRGWDVLDEDNDGCAGPGNPGNDPGTCPSGQQRNRWKSGGASNDARPDAEFWKLGDIFHSSPVLVRPPATETICDLALDNQCAATIHSPQGFSATQQTPAEYDVDGDGTIERGEDAYEKYRRDKAARRQFVLVGANDGMLHAFDAGDVDPGVPVDSFGQYTYRPGTGAELWAFVPPDQLPRLKLMLDGHTYSVDGNAMVRDVWVDHDANGRKTPDEFHTLAVLSERSGGNSYTALDVTDPANPVFRWTYPPNCTTDQTIMGQSWSGFAPRPPPIGPVKLAVSGATQDPTGRGFEERWIVMVNGGFDSVMTRGRGVWMMDAWTGATLWRFRDSDFKDLMGISNNDTGMWPVPAAAALLDVEPIGVGVTPGDGFFDTANWPDMGGQLWVARFEQPGTIDPATGLVTNWFAARAFEEQRLATGKQNIAGRSEFFFMTSNALDGQRVHSYMGSGNRDRLLQSGASCGASSLLGCCQGGCNGDFSTDYDFLGCTVSSKFHCNNGNVQQDRDAFTGSCGGVFACGQMKAKATAHLVCGSAGNPPDTVAQMVCDANGVCTTDQTVKEGKLVREERLTQPTTHNRFYGIWSYGAPRTFATAGGASTFDANRFTDIAYGGSCNGTVGNTCTLVETTYADVNAAGGVTCSVGTKCSATSDDAGWFYEYGRKCPLASCSETPPWLDEKTASGSTVMSGCVDWNTFRPRGGQATTDPCVAQNVSANATNFTYLSDMVSGTPSTTCGLQADASCGVVSTIYRASQRSTIAPPPDPTQMVGIGMDGEVRYFAVQIEPSSGISGTQLGSRSEMSQSGYWLEVPRDLHTCRHVDPTTCK